jgi:hypothetical protein
VKPTLDKEHFYRIYIAIPMKSGGTGTVEVQRTCA